MNAVATYTRTRARIMLVTFIINVFLGAFGTGAGIVYDGLKDIEHHIEQRIENTIIKKVCARAAGESALAKICDPTKSLKEKFNEWRREKMGQLKDKLKGRDIKISDRSQAEADQTAAEDIQAEAGDTPLPDTVLEDLVAEGDPAQADTTDPATQDAAQIDANPGETASTAEPMQPVDTEVAVGDGTEATAIGDTVTSAAEEGSKLVSVASNAGKFLFSKGNILTFAIIATWTVGNWAVGDIDRWNSGPMYWDPWVGLDGQIGGTVDQGFGKGYANDTTAAIHYCQLPNYLAEFQQPTSRISETFFWQWDTSRGAPVPLPSFGQFSVVSQWNVGPTGIASGADPSMCDYILHPDPAKTNAQIDQAFIWAETNSFSNIVAHPSTISLNTVTTFLSAEPPAIDQSLNDLFREVGGEQNYAHIVGLAWVPSRSPITNKSLQDIRSFFQDQISRAQSSNNPAAAAGVAQLEQEMEATFVTGADLSATVLQTKGTAYQQLLADMRAGHRDGWLQLREMSLTAVHTDTRHVLNQLLNESLTDCGCTFQEPLQRIGPTKAQLYASNEAQLAKDEKACLCILQEPDVLQGGGTITLGEDPSDPTLLDNNTTAMLMAVQDLFGGNLSADANGDVVQSGEPGPMGNVGAAGLLPSQYIQGSQEAGNTSVDTSVEQQYTAAGTRLADYLQASGGDMEQAFAMYVHDNNLPPMDGKWGAETSGPATNGWADLFQGSDGADSHMPTSALLSEVASQYLDYLNANEPNANADGNVCNNCAEPSLDPNGNLVTTSPAPGGASGNNTTPSVNGYPLPPVQFRGPIDAAAKQLKVPVGLLYAIAGDRSNFSLEQSDWCGDSTYPGTDQVLPAPNGGKPYPARPVPMTFGPFGMTPQEFTYFGHLAGLPASAFIPAVAPPPTDGTSASPSASAAPATPNASVNSTDLPNTGWCPYFGEPQGMLDISQEALAEATMLRAFGTGNDPTDTGNLEAAAWVALFPSMIAPNGQPLDTVDQVMPVLPPLPSFIIDKLLGDAPSSPVANNDKASEQQLIDDMFGSQKEFLGILGDEKKPSALQLMVADTIDGLIPNLYAISHDEAYDYQWWADHGYTTGPGLTSTGGNDPGQSGSFPMGGHAGTVVWRQTIGYAGAAPQLWPGVGHGAAGWEWGQCTWFSVSNSNAVLKGNGGDMYGNAAKAGEPTLPGSQLPPPGAVVSWYGGDYGRSTGHTGVVVYDDPQSHYYVVAEANFWHETAYNDQGVPTTPAYIDLRQIPFPDPELQGSVLPTSPQSAPNFAPLSSFLAAHAGAGPGVQ